MLRGWIAGRMKRIRVSASFMTGAVALVFLIIGYQTALFLHKSAMLKILGNRDRPDTVYVIDPEMARAVLAEARPDSAAAFRSVPGLPEKPAAADDRLYVRKDSEHHPAVAEIRSSIPSRNVESFRFDPNTVTVNDLVRLGFSEKQALSIDNYRKKGGRFRRKGDFARSYVVADSVYDRLEPYIDIPLIDINLADSAAFDDLPGIGGYFAARMVDYRRRLGGSYSFKEQLMDIWRFNRERFDGLSDLITVAPEHIRPYRLWTLPEDSLRLHPYIGSWAVAHGIVLFRENNPASEWTVGSLSEAGILKPEMAEKLARCVIEPPPAAVQGQEP